MVHSKRASVDDSATEKAHEDEGTSNRHEDEEVNYVEGESLERVHSEETISPEVTVPSLPLKMYFAPEEYMKPFKLSAKCYIKKAVDTLESHLNSSEKRWFREHPQFGHFFHMPRDNNHRMMGMWMLMLRTAYTEKKNEVWFVVNGIPIRYSLTEMALISGLYCHQYPNDYERLGSLVWAGKQFGRGSTVRFQDVEEKLMEMKRGTQDRLKMAVLYFLCSIIVGKRKTGVNAESVEPFFLRAVDDLDLCETFPWGRFAFDQNLKDLSHILTHFDGTVGSAQIFPSFIMPLELLAFEAIPSLMNTYREHVRETKSECPWMCKMKLKKTSMKGIPMEELLDQLGTTKEIQSIMTPYPGEKVLLQRTMDEGVGYDDVDCPVVDYWMRLLTVYKKPIWFEDLYNKDLAAREGTKMDKGSAAEENVAETSAAPERRMKGKGSVAQGGVSRADLIELKTLFEVEFKKLNDKIGEQNTRITRLEANVRFLGGDLGGDWCGTNVDEDTAPPPPSPTPISPLVDEDTAPPPPPPAPISPLVDEEIAPPLALNLTDLDDPAPSPAADAPALKNVYGRNKKKRTREEKEKEIVPEAHNDGEEEPNCKRVKIIPKRGKEKGKTVVIRSPMKTRAKNKK